METLNIIRHILEDEDFKSQFRGTEKDLINEKEQEQLLKSMGLDNGN